MKRACGARRKPRAAELQTRQSLKLRTAQSQLHHASLRNQLALAHDQHLVESIEETQPMHGGHEAGLREIAEQGRIEARRGGGIETRGRLIEQYQRAALRGEHASCKSNTAALSTGPVGRPLGDGSLETQWRRLYKVGCEGDLQCLGVSPRGRRTTDGLAFCEILAQSPFVYLGVLRNECGSIAQNLRCF